MTLFYQHTFVCRHLNPVVQVCFLLIFINRSRVCYYDNLLFSVWCSWFYGLYIALATIELLNNVFIFLQDLELDIENLELDDDVDTSDINLDDELLDD